jgi:hypothetical protein
VTEGVCSARHDTCLQTQAICRWTKQRKPGKAKAGLPGRSITRLVSGCKFERYINVSFPPPIFLLTFFMAHIFLSAWMRNSYSLPEVLLGDVLGHLFTRALIYCPYIFHILT